MTLKEKINDNLFYIEPKLYINKVEKVAEDFAIGFAEWIRIKDFQTTHKNTWIGVDMEHYLTKELLEIYKKEKEL